MGGEALRRGRLTGADTAGQEHRTCTRSPDLALPVAGPFDAVDSAIWRALLFGRGREGRVSLVGTAAAVAIPPAVWSDASQCTFAVVEGQWREFERGGGAREGLPRVLWETSREDFFFRAGPAPRPWEIWAAPASPAMDRRPLPVLPACREPPRFAGRAAPRCQNTRL